jgi:hypothetical protein
LEYRLLGLSGCAVSALAPGTLTFGNETSETDSFAQLDRFVAAGGTLIHRRRLHRRPVRADHRPLAGQPGGGARTRDDRAPDYPYGERGQSQRDRRISGGRF